MLYFMLVDLAFFQDRVRPALSASWRSRSFEPCQELRDSLIVAGHDFAERFHCNFEDSLLHHFRADMPFDRSLWRGLVSEVLLYGAKQIPEVPDVFDGLARLLNCQVQGDASNSREQFDPLQQIQHGSRDLCFGGGYYRPEHAGYNSLEDVARLTAYLDSIRTDTWKVSDLDETPGLDAEDAHAELEYAGQGFKVVCDLYHQAQVDKHIVVCEDL
jgi:hypothetical protein